jgi:hypothetical protein
MLSDVTQSQSCLKCVRPRVTYRATDGLPVKENHANGGFEGLREATLKSTII